MLKPLVRFTVGALAIGAFAGAYAQSTAPGAEEPKIQSYSIDVEAKVLSDRRNRGISDTFRRPSAELTVTAAHESGVIGYLQLGGVRKEVFPESDGVLVTGALGYRWGRHDGWHFGVGAAQEWFPGAKASGAPTGFDWSTGNPTGFTDTKFDTTYGVFEFGHGIVEARYLYVLSKDLRGNNTATLCGTAYLPQLLAGGDPSKAIACYGDGFKRTGGSHLLDVDIKYPLDGRTKLTLHAGYQKTRNFGDANLFDYRLGVVHTRWGFDFGAEVVGVSLKNRDFAVAVDSAGNSKQLDETALVVSVGKRF
ncbi:MAG TPA: hypothetical protein VEC06_16425 [Paucimonas sp.]|nr:hypothetical protein [Paucimonas sp.]